MPEGPSILILKEAAVEFAGQKVLEATGSVKDINFSRLEGKKITGFKSWGKHFLICFDGFFIRIHLMLFGTYRINDHRKVAPKLGLQFAQGELNFYACLVKLTEGDPGEVYDWSADIMSPHWSPKKALDKLLERPSLYLCDVLLDQDIFAGSGNIIKNEALFRAKLHPLNKIADVPREQLSKLIGETSKYSFDFLEWKKKGTLKKHWEAYHKTTCPRDGHKIEHKDTGRTHRASFYCNSCQKLYTR